MMEMSTSLSKLLQELYNRQVKTHWSFRGKYFLVRNCNRLQRGTGLCAPDSCTDYDVPTIYDNLQQSVLGVETCHFTDSSFTKVDIEGFATPKDGVDMAFMYRK